MKNKFSSFFWTFFLLLACGENHVDKDETLSSFLPVQKATSEAFNQYWYQGVAELSSFSVQQARYGEVRPGKAVMIFVTEDFLLDEQLKKESASEKEAVSVLKMNFDRQFKTGIYDYSMMTSVFSPVSEHQWMQPLKISCSSQEWCGHSWTQINRKPDHFLYQQHSYFESEGDLEKELDTILFEDGIWNQIRLDPEKINQGKVMMFPGTQFLRFSHLQPKAYEAQINRGDFQEWDSLGMDLKIVQIVYAQLNRSLKIIYERDYPHAIVGWIESRPSGLRRPKVLKTTAQRINRIRIDYWSKNQRKHAFWRDSLFAKNQILDREE